MAEVKTAVFDVDGTLINTFEHIVQAFEVVLPRHDVEPDRENIRKVIGMTLIDCYRHLVPEGDHEAMAELHHETQQTPEMYELIVMYDGLRETLELMRSGGVQTAVQTNRSRRSVDLIFNHLGMTDLFDCVVTPNEVAKPKPDPEGIVLISSKLGVSPEQTVMVGDTPTDVLTGKNAGCAATFALTHGFGTRQELELAKPDYIADSFREFEAQLIDAGILNGS